MTDFTRTISIVTLIFLAFFCFQTGIFLCSGHTIKQNGRRTLIFIEFFTGFLLFFDALAYIYRGNTSTTGFYLVRLSNFLVFICNFSASFFFCFYVIPQLSKIFSEINSVKRQDLQNQFTN